MAFEVEPVGVVKQAVQDGVGVGRVGNDVVPGSHGVARQSGCDSVLPHPRMFPKADCRCRAGGHAEITGDVRLKKNMPRVRGFRSFNTARRSIQGFEAMLWLRKGFGFAGARTVHEQNPLLGFCFGLSKVNGA